jgi:hypothetical protein
LLEKGEDLSRVLLHPFSHVQSCSRALSYVNCKSVRWNTLTSFLPLEVSTTCPSSLVFSFLCLHFMGHVCVDFTIPSKRRWTKPTPSPSPSRFFFFWLAF